MIGLITKFFPNLKIATIVGIVFLGIGTVAGWKARDYLADRKELKLLEQKLSEANKRTSEWERKAGEFQASLARQNSEAAKRESERAASQTRANELSAQVLKLKNRLTVMEKAHVKDEAGDLVCERTDPCQWMFLNAAYKGTSVPAQCASSLPDQARGKLLLDAGVDR